MPVLRLTFPGPVGKLWRSTITFCAWGKEGYRKIHNACYETAHYLSAEIEKLGMFDIIYDGKGGIPAMSWSLKEGADPGSNLFDLSDRIRSRGWQIAAYAMPPKREDLVIMRILVRHGFSRDQADLLVDDLQRCIDFLCQKSGGSRQ